VGEGSAELSVFAAKEFGWFVIKEVLRLDIPRAKKKTRK